eukprot:6210801-Pleurochrysis_carterae.AAC.1
MHIWASALAGFIDNTAAFTLLAVIRHAVLGGLWSDSVGRCCFYLRHSPRPIGKGCRQLLAAIVGAPASDGTEVHPARLRTGSLLRRTKVPRVSSYIIIQFQYGEWCLPQKCGIMCNAWRSHLETARYGCYIPGCTLCMPVVAGRRGATAEYSSKFLQDPVSALGSCHKLLQSFMYDDTKMTTSNNINIISIFMIFMVRTI